MTTPPTPDAGGINEPRVITALHLLRDLGFTALYDAEENPAAGIADILDAWDSLTAQLAAANADVKKCRDGYMMVADATCASSTGPEDLAAKARRVRAERDALRNIDDATVERAAEAIADLNTSFTQRLWDDLRDEDRAWFRKEARAALDAARTGAR